MRLLGAILCGGRSRRFGSDKAAAMVGGIGLLEHVRASLASQVEELVLVGRPNGVPDQPQPNLGPLGGLCAALEYAALNGFDAVLSAGCDVLPIPKDLARTLAPGPAVVEGQRLLGLWPSELAPRLRELLGTETDRSVRNWVEVAGARTVKLPTRLWNLNTREDLALYCHSERLVA